MLRRGKYKFTYSVNDIPELYDLESDPDEMNNLALNGAHQHKVDEMKAELFAWYTPPEATDPKL